jgi:hypothetical protein
MIVKNVMKVILTLETADKTFDIVYCMYKFFKENIDKINIRE